MAELIVAILKAIVQIFLPEAKKAATDTMQESKQPTALNNAWAKRVKSAGWLLVLWFTLGCGTQVIYVKPGDIVRLRETVPNVKIWMHDGQGKVIPAECDLENGWYCGSLSESTVK